MSKLDVAAIRARLNESARAFGRLDAGDVESLALCDRVAELEAAITQALVHFGECSIPAAEETLRAALGIPEGP
jgi:hypothetical protein